MPNKFCSNCGDDLVEGAKFCDNCGQTIGSSISTDPKTMHLNFKIPKRLLEPTGRRHSEIITTDSSNGEPVVKFRNLHPNAIWLFFFQYLGKTSIILLVMGIAAFIEPLTVAAAATLYFVILFVTAYINYRNYEFEVSPVAFRKQYGVFHKYAVNISYEQIQNVNKRRTIIDRMLGLAHLEIDTAGTGGEVSKSIGGLKTVAEGYIPGITPDEADDVMDLILARIQQS